MKKLSEMTDELVQGSDLGSLHSEPESRPERRRRWMAEALAEYAASDVEKVWSSIDGEDFIEQ